MPWMTKKEREWIKKQAIDAEVSSGAVHRAQ